jgi:two-component system, OmpR family, response regulator
MRRRILLVEDSPDTGQSLMSVLRSMGHEVQLAIDGASARRAARSSPVDMIVLDILLPDCTGWELAREFRVEPGLAQAPIVAISGQGSAQDKRRSFDAGCDYHLVKPLNLRYLESLLTQI